MTSQVVAWRTCLAFYHAEWIDEAQRRNRKKTSAVHGW